MQRRWSIAVVVALAATVLSLANAPANASGGRIPTDGRTSETAAASCWDIKQRWPDSESGAYWLLTSGLRAPQTFYCDMETDGGGWVLVGRGREGWTFRGEGQGRPQDMAENPDGTDAFEPYAWDNATIDALLGGERVDALADGVRLRRATNRAGTTWQNMRLDFRTLENWTWAWSYPLFLDSVTIGGFEYRGSNTGDTAWDWSTDEPNALLGINDARRLVMRQSSTFGWYSGFTMGELITGSGGATDYLHDPGSDGFPQPFTQVYLRPRLTDADIAAAPIPPTGTDAQRVRQLLDDFPDALPHGVSGWVEGNQASFFGEPHEVQVWGLTQSGDRIFAGGGFTDVVHKDLGPTRQRYLAAFDVDTGAWDTSFLPTIPGPIYDLDTLPDGRIIAVGDFPGGVLVVDQNTGAIDRSWPISLSFESGPVFGRSLDVEAGKVYIGGRFTHVTPAGQARQRVFNLIRADARTGVFDAAWRPGANDRVEDIDAVAGDGRVYLAGHFSSVNQQPNTQGIAVVNMTDGATVPTKQYEMGTGKLHYQQAVLRGTNGTLYIGGAEHNVHQYDRADLTFRRSHITQGGGDFQRLIEIDGVVYASCHCEGVLLNDTNTFPISTDHRRSDRVNFLVALDADTFEVIGDFMPKFRSGEFHEGPWALLEDSNGCLWAGGDMAEAGWNGSGYDFASGFVRMCPRDRTPPPTPTNFQVTVDNSGAHLSWRGVNDPTAAYMRYEILHDDRVVQTQWGWEWTWTGNSHAAEASTWAVRAVDPEGNVGRSTTPITYVPAPTVTTLVPLDATWQYLDDGTAPDPCWTTGCELPWPSGPAPLGWGMNDIATELDRAPLVHHAVLDFEVTPEHLTANEGVQVRIQRDDGVALWLNGEPLFRSNVPEGDLDTTTRASDFVVGAAQTEFVTVDIPAGVLQLGTNRIAASLHQYFRDNPDGRLAVAVDLIGCASHADGTDACFR